MCRLGRALALAALVVVVVVMVVVVVVSLASSELGPGDETERRGAESAGVEELIVVDSICMAM